MSCNIVSRGGCSEMFENIHVDVNKFLFSSLDISDYQAIECVEFFEHSNAHSVSCNCVFICFSMCFYEDVNIRKAESKGKNKKIFRHIQKSRKFVL